MERKRYTPQGNARSANHPNPRRQPAPALPEARLRRLGASHAALKAVEAWWAAQTTDIDRRAGLDRLSVLSDRELHDMLGGMDALADGTAQGIDAWARKQPDRPLAAGIAVAVERGRGDQARAGLLNRLESIQ